jgi:hypothetical protein
MLRLDHGYKKESKQVTECCIKGCERKHRALGFCNHHYMQWMRYGHPLSKELMYIRHGNRKPKSTTREYRSWCGMIQRCYKSYSPMYANYGGRGISVCEQWRSSFTQFLEDMGKCPEDCSIDRIDFNGNYEPSNCRWANNTVQNQNRRTTILNEKMILSARKRSSDGEKICDISRNLNVPYNTLWQAIRKNSWKYLC